MEQSTLWFSIKLQKGHQSVFGGLSCANVPWQKQDLKMSSGDSAGNKSDNDAFALDVCITAQLLVFVRGITKDYEGTGSSASQW